MAIFSLANSIYALVLIIASFVMYWALKKNKVSKDTLMQFKQMLKIYEPQISDPGVKEVLKALITVLAYYTGENANKAEFHTALAKLDSLNLGISWKKHIAKLKEVE